MVAVSVGLQSRTSTALVTAETAPEQHMHTVCNPNDRGVDTEMRKLSSGSHSYWEQNKVTNTPVAPSIEADFTGGTWDISGSTTLYLAAEAALEIHGLALGYILP